MNRPKKRSPMGFLLLLAALLALLYAAGKISSFVQGGPPGSGFSEPPGSSAVGGSGQDAALRVLRGTVEDATMNTLTVRGEDGERYTFATEGVAITTGKDGLLIGDSVVLTFRGALDASLPAQNVEILSIAVGDRETQPEETPGPPPEDGSPSPNPAAEQAQSILETMTLEEKVGQMFIARCPEENAAQKAADYHLGGYILFGRDFAQKTGAEIVRTIRDYQDAVKIPLFIGVDEEGGTVNRISTNPRLRAVPFWAPQELYAAGGFDLIRSDTQEKCILLHSLGINLNFAPVCDVSQDPNDFIYSRSFGQDAPQTAQYVRTVVETMAQEGMGSVLKHFPGYGNNADTHSGMAYDDRPYETFRTSDLLPFEAGIDSGASMVLVSHNVIRCMDDRFPASLSPAVHRVLREELNYSGVIITDDLFMEGVRDFAPDNQTAVLAVQAGNDLLCCRDFEVQIPAVLNAVKEGAISESRIDESVLRILELKLHLGMI